MTETHEALDIPAFSHPIASVSGIQERLGAFSLFPNKALGQNFLADAEACRAITACVPADVPVLEIGPGLGALTASLLECGHRVAAVEKDAAMVRVLQSTLACPSLRLWHADALTVELSDIQNWLRVPFWIAGNLPYYITTPLVWRLLCAGLPLCGFTFTVQLEAAERFFALPGQRVYGPLGVLIALHFTAKKRMELSPHSFYPQPDVHSAVISFACIHPPEPAFSSFLTGIFAMRRKTLCNNLLHMGYAKPAILDACASCGQSESARAEALPPQTLQQLFYALTSHPQTKA